jgi:hypothetical protein
MKTPKFKGTAVSHFVHPERFSIDIAASDIGPRGIPTM